MTNKRYASQHKRSFIKGAFFGFLTSFVAVFLTTPVEGQIAREKTSDAVTWIKNAPEHFQQTKDSLYQSGQQRYERIYKELDKLKKKARMSAAKEHALLEENKIKE